MATDAPILPPDNPPVGVFDAPFGRVGLSICYDLRFPELYRAMGAQYGDLKLIMVPAAFTATTGRAHWEVLLRARAIENQCYVLAPAQGGTHENGLRAGLGKALAVAVDLERCAAAILAVDDQRQRGRIDDAGGNPDVLLPVVGPGRNPQVCVFELDAAEQDRVVAAEFGHARRHAVVHAGRPHHLAPFEQLLDRRLRGHVFSPLRFRCRHRASRPAGRPLPARATGPRP